MIPVNELRIGNRVLWNAKLLQTNLPQQLPQIEVTEIHRDKIGYVPLHLEYRMEFFDDALIAEEKHYELLEEIKPIPITKELLLQLPKKIKYPDWIKYLHELQNWFFWQNKKELSIENND